ncbi:MAG: CRISPR system precrRNA processing endoribonuclease RAMP protein Cas6 [Acidimicrobiales bacterium]
MHEQAGVWRFEVGVADDAVAGRVFEALGELAALRVGRSSWRHVGTTVVSASYRELRDRARPASWFALEFRTPTTVRIAAGGARRSWPLPLPDVLFGRLWDRWGCFAPADAVLPAETAAVIEDRLAVSGHRIRTASHVTKFPDGKVVGFVGRVEFQVLEARRCSEDALAGVAALARFAALTGMGDQTAKGMGWVVAAGAER